MALIRSAALLVLLLILGYLSLTLATGAHRAASHAPDVRAVDVRVEDRAADELRGFRVDLHNRAATPNSILREIARLTSRTLIVADTMPQGQMDHYISHWRDGVNAHDAITRVCNPFHRGGMSEELRISLDAPGVLFVFPTYAPPRSIIETRTYDVASIVNGMREHRIGRIEQSVAEGDAPANFNAATMMDSVNRLDHVELEEELMFIVTEAVFRDLWEDNGGLAASMGTLGGLWTVTAPAFMHDEISELLQVIEGMLR